MKQQVLFGDNSFEKIKQILTEKGIGSVFVITGCHFSNDNSYIQNMSVFNSFRHQVFVKDGVNVTFEEIDRAYGIYNSENVQAIVAIGGGSVMDLAKGVIYKDSQRGKVSKPYLIAVPTTAGSGSEATCIAVVYENKKKQSLENNLLLPDTAILDPRLLVSLPPLQTAISGIDAFAQAIESFWSIHATTHSKFLGREALVSLIEYLPQSIHAPTRENRGKVLWASHLAGKAINIARTTGPHALSYFLTAHHNIPHGQAVAIFLPLFFIYNSSVHENNCNHPDGPGAVAQSLQELNLILQVKSSEEAFEYTRTFIQSLGLAIDFNTLGINKSTFDQLVDEVNQQRFKNNPVLFDREALVHLFREYL